MKRPPSKSSTRAVVVDASGAFAGSNHVCVGPRQAPRIACRCAWCGVRVNGLTGVATTLGPALGVALFATFVWRAGVFFAGFFAGFFACFFAGFFFVGMRARYRRFDAVASRCVPLRPRWRPARALPYTLVMGRIFETRKATMFARWNKMAKAFTRVSKDIAMAVKSGGPNPDTNPALRRAVTNARALNMPREKVESAIKRAHEGKDTSNYEELIYEGYGPHGIACIVVTATDNPTRTVANIRSGFGRNGGNMGTTGSVSFAFKRMGVFRLDPASVKSQDELELELIDHGLEEMGESSNEKGEKQLVIRCAMESFGAMQQALESRGLSPTESGSEFVPLNMVTLPEDQATEVLKMVDALEQDDDVQNVFHNLG